MNAENAEPFLFSAAVCAGMFRAAWVIPAFSVGGLYLLAATCSKPLDAEQTF
jgi:hypothetical protein